MIPVQEFPVCFPAFTLFCAWMALYFSQRLIQGEYPDETDVKIWICNACNAGCDSGQCRV